MSAQTLADTNRSAGIQPRKMIYEEYLAWTDEDVHSEWVNGEVFVFMPPLPPHQTLIEFLTHVIGMFIAVFDLGKLLIAPLELRLRPEGNSREPDLMFLSSEHMNRLTDKRVSGTPDLIIEVVSDDSAYRDRVDKFDEYEAGGVPEYWILDNRPNRNRAQFFQLNERGRYVAVEPDDQGIYRSKVLPGFWLRVDSLWQEFPDQLRAIAEIIGPDRMAEALRKAMRSPRE